MRSHERAFVKTVLALVVREVLEPRSPVELLYGDGADVLAHLGG